MENNEMKFGKVSWEVCFILRVFIFALDGGKGL